MVKIADNPTHVIDFTKRLGDIVYLFVQLVVNERDLFDSVN
jgi:hypothetical protein